MIGQTEIRRYEFQNRKFDTVERLLEFRNIPKFQQTFDSPVEIPKISKFLLNFDSSNFRKVFLCRISNGITTTANVTAILLSEFHWNFDSIYLKNGLIYRTKFIIAFFSKGSPLLEFSTHELVYLCYR